MKASWSEKQILKNLTILLFIGFLYFLFVRWSFKIEGLSEMIISLIIFFVLLVFFKKFARILSNFMNGDKGELDVRIQLRHLPKNYIYLSDINLERKGNIDFILIGSTGIWMIEVKSHIGSITFDGTELRKNGELLEKDFIKQAWAEAFSVKNFLKEKLGREIFIQPVIVFSNTKAKIKFGFKMIKGVYIIGLKWLNKLVLNDENTLKTEEIEKIADIIKQYNIKD